MDNKRGKVGPGIGIYFMLSKLASTWDERIGSNAVITGGDGVAPPSRSQTYHASKV